MKKSKWTFERTDQLLALVADGLSRREISGRMGLVINAVTTKLHIMGVLVPLNPANYAPCAQNNAVQLAQLARFPRFEDITRTEARAVRRGAPRSAPYVRQPDYSLTGNAADMCTF